MRKRSVATLIGIFTLIPCLAISVIKNVFLLNLELFSQKGLFSFPLRSAGAIGLIGGSDGPTAIFISGKVSPKIWIVPACLFITEIILVLLFFRSERKEKPKN